MSDDIIGNTLKRTNAICRRFFGHHFACTMLTTFTFIRPLAELCLGASEGRIRYMHISRCMHLPYITTIQHRKKWENAIWLVLHRLCCINSFFVS